MTLEIIHEAPVADAFVPLSSHQSQTPDSFFSGKPVLHYQDRGSTLIISSEDSESLPITPNHSNSGEEASASTNGEANGKLDEDSPTAEDIVLTIDIWVTSGRVIIFNPSLSKGVSIPYPSILLHAIQHLPTPHGTADVDETTGLYMQVSKSSSDADAGAEDDYEDEQSLELRIIPSTSATPADQSQETSPVQALFAAISTCSNMHPDPVVSGSGLDDEDDEEDDYDDPIIFEGNVGYESGMVLPGNNSGDGGLPPPFPGSGGWITAENVGEYFDDEGNWKGGAGATQGLGPGAGNVRTREEGDASQSEEDARANPTIEETKWRRTE